MYSSIYVAPKVGMWESLREYLLYAYMDPSELVFEGFHLDTYSLFREDRHHPNQNYRHPVFVNGENG